MSGLELWVTIFLMGALAFAVRYVPMALLERFKLPPTLQQGLRYVPAATLAGLVFPALFTHDGQWAIGLGNERMIAGLLALYVAWRFKNVLLTLGVGMGVLWLLQWLFP